MCRPCPISHPPPVSRASPARSRRPGRRTCSSSSSSSARSDRPERASPISATTDQITRSPPSTREMRPSIAQASSGTGAMAVHTANRVGSSTRIGAMRPPSPATPNDRNVTPPRNVPAAAPGSPLALAAIPAARFSVSNPERATDSTNAEIPRVRAIPSSPSTNTSAANTTTTSPITRTMTPAAPDKRPTSSQNAHRRRRRAVVARAPAAVSFASEEARGLLGRLGGEAEAADQFGQPVGRLGQLLCRGGEHLRRRGGLLRGGRHLLGGRR